MVGITTKYKACFSGSPNGVRFMVNQVVSKQHVQVLHLPEEYTKESFTKSSRLGLGTG